MLELQNFQGYFLDDKGHLFKLTSKRGLVQKKAFYKGSRLGFKLGQVFLSTKQLKAEPLSQTDSYIPPF